MKDNDLALQALIEARDSVDPGLPIDLIKELHAIQEKYQFAHESERSECYHQMAKLIKEFSKEFGEENEDISE